VSSTRPPSQGPTGTVQFLSNGSNLMGSVNCAAAGATSTAGASCTATLTTTLSALPPGFFDQRPRPNPPIVIIWLAALCALICMLLALRLPTRQRVFTYAGLVLFACVAAGIAGCSGSSGGSGGGGGGHTDNITATYGGDSNYATSKSVAAQVTIQ
jgi:hypothetical protein